MSLCSKFWNQEMWVFLFCFPFSELFWLFWVSYYSLLILQPNCQFLMKKSAGILDSVESGDQLRLYYSINKVNFSNSWNFSKYFIHFDTASRIVFLGFILGSWYQNKIRLIFVSCNFATYIHMFVLLLLMYNSILSFPLWRTIIVIYINVLIL